jgi:hypothetical protein
MTGRNGGGEESSMDQIKKQRGVKTGQAAVLFGRLLHTAVALTARLAGAARRALPRIVDRLEQTNIETLLTRSGQRLDTAMRWSGQRLKAATRWARKHDTVPAAVVERLHQQSEARIRTSEVSRARRQQRRLEKEAERQRRVQRYGEKSSIYMG